MFLIPYTGSQIREMFAQKEQGFFFHFPFSFLFMSYVEQFKIALLFIAIKHYMHIYKQENIFPIFTYLNSVNLIVGLFLVVKMLSILNLYTYLNIYRKMLRLSHLEFHKSSWPLNGNFKQLDRKYNIWPKKPQCFSNIMSTKSEIIFFSNKNVLVHI